MDGGALVTTIGALIRIGVLLLYVPVVLISYWKLIPRLAPSAKRVATAMLATQILIIYVSLEVQTSTDFDRWLWDFHEEWNIPAAFAYLQLALVGGVAFLTAGLARGRPALLRLYLVAIGLVFLFLAADEYLALHEVVQDWEIRYVALGAAIIAATLLVALRSPRRTWLWHICLLVGLAISVAGAMVLNALPIPCGGLGLLRFDGCVEYFFLEESFEFMGIWLTLVALLGHYSIVAPTPSPRVRQILYMLPLAGILVLIMNTLAPRLELRLLAQPASVQVKSDIELRGFHIDQNAGGTVVRLYVSARQADYMGIGFSLHFVDQVSGESVASRDEWADRQHGIGLLGADYRPMYRQWLGTSASRRRRPSTARTGSFSRFGEKKTAASSSARKSSQAISRCLTTDRLCWANWFCQLSSLAGRQSRWAAFENGFALESVDLPNHAQRGEILDITFAWRSNAAGLDNYSQFLHFIHAESGEWWGYDQAPLGQRLPTRLWYSGLADSETWRVPLADLAPGRGLHRLVSLALERVPAKDAEGTPA